jgi:hypothetical protein
MSERKESEKEKVAKEEEQDAKNIAVIARSKRNGICQNSSGYNRYPRYGEKLMNDEYYEEGVNREDLAHPIVAPIGFTIYKSPTIDVKRFVIVNSFGWRIALPRSLSSEQVKFVLSRIYYNGPKSVGYVISGDTLVPANLSYANRAVLASS